MGASAYGAIHCHGAVAGNLVEVLAELVGGQVYGSGNEALFEFVGIADVEEGVVEQGGGA